MEAASAQLQTDFPFFTLQANENQFFDLKLSKTAFTNNYNARNLDDKKRIVFTTQDFIDDDDPSYSAGLLITIWNYPGGFTEAVLTPTLGAGSSAGQAAFPEGHKLSKDDFALLMEHHEIFHVRDQSFKIRAGHPSTLLGIDYRAVMADFIKTGLLTEAEGVREARAGGYEKGGALPCQAYQRGGGVLRPA